MLSMANAEFKRRDAALDAFRHAESSTEPHPRDSGSRICRRIDVRQGLVIP
jgi:hypothetical protein